MRYFSQVNQDEILDRYIFHHKRNGTFVDVGAYDGMKYSNSLFFERYRGWSGICIEPIPKVFQQLRENRPNTICIEACTGNKNQSAVSFNWVDGPSEMLSGLVSTYHPNHLIRIQSENDQLGGLNRILKVQMVRLENVFDEHEMKHIDYLSIDTEGAELATLQGINFQRVIIDVIDIEENYATDARQIATFLQSKGYVPFHKIEMDKLYVRRSFLEEASPALEKPPSPLLALKTVIRKKRRRRQFKRRN